MIFMSCSSYFMVCFLLYYTERKAVLYLAIMMAISAQHLHEKVTFYSCNMSMSALPVMYTRCPSAASPRAEGGHIRQTTSANVTTVSTTHLIGGKPKLSAALILDGCQIDCGKIKLMIYLRLPIPFTTLSHGNATIKTLSAL